MYHPEPPTWPEDLVAAYVRAGLAEGELRGRLEAAQGAQLAHGQPVPEEVQDEGQQEDVPPPEVPPPDVPPPEEDQPPAEGQQPEEQQQ